MEPEKRCLKAGAIAIILAMVFHLIAGAESLPRPPEELTSLIGFLETGRRLPHETVPEPTQPPVLPKPVPPKISVPIQKPREIVPPVFTADDLDNVWVRYDGDYRPDLPELMTAPLDLNLYGGKPAVLILHTHGCESFEDVSPGVWRTTDPEKNMIAVGEELEKLLTDAGISVLHDRELHDYPSYNYSYADSREAAQDYLAQYPSIQLVLDLHRDAADTDDGQLDTSATVNGKESAQILVVVGTDENGLDHPHWQDNLSLGLKLTAQLETFSPGISRYVSLRTERFNQDLGPHALLIEVGGAGNTLQEAKNAVSALADAIIALSAGANVPDP